MYSELQEGLSDSLTTGSSIAGTRETDLISFSTLFGDAQVAEQFLSDIKDMANVTPFLYDDLTSMSKTLKTFGYAVSEMIPALTAVGDTGAALGLSVSDMNIVATAIGRMRQTDKVTLEYLNMLSERGIAAIDWMAEAGGISKGDVYSNISAGRYSGEQMAQLILDNMALNYGGAMERQSQTFSGLSSTLEGLTQELYNAQGEGYNAARKQGIQDQIDFLGSEAGGQMQQAYALIGEYQASLENRQEELLRDALSSVMSGSLTGSMEGVSEAFRVQLESLSEDYDRAKLEKNGAEMGRVLMEAKALAEAEYTNTEEYQMQVDAQEELIAGVQQAVAGSYYDAGYDLAKELSRGMTAGLKYQANAIEESVMALAGTGYTWTVHGDGSKEYRDLNGNLIELGTYAYGLARVPYDNYPALLHEGERVLTAAEARRYGGTNLQIAKIADTVVIREDADIDRIAAAIADRVQQARWTDTGV